MVMFGVACSQERI